MIRQNIPKDIQHWNAYKRVRNQTINELRKSKKKYFDNVAGKLNNPNIKSKDWWKILKTYIKPLQNSSIPPLKHNDEILTEQIDKANLLNKYFKEKSSIEDDGKRFYQTLS